MLDKSTAIEFFKGKYRTTYYKYNCIGDDCNETIIVQQSALKRHSGKCRRCCQKIKPYEHIFNELKHTCLRNNKFEMTLTYDEFLTLISNDKCHYCTKSLVFSKHTRDFRGVYTSRAYQLDRKDNSKGYSFDNLVTCCWECNRLKSDIYSYDEFMIIAEALKIVQINKN